MQRSRKVLRQALLVAALSLAAAAAPAAPVEFALPTTATATPVAASAVRDYPGAAQAIVQVLTTSLQMAVPAYRMEVYATPAEFEAAMVRHLRMAPDTARSAAAFAKAAVGNRRILVNETQMAKVDWPERLLTLAHEMVHAAQLELSGHKSLTRTQWLVEGFAEWVAFRVVDELGTHSLATERGAMRQRVLAARDKVGLAKLVDLDTLAQWVRSREQRGFDAAYPYAYLATDHLIARHSLGKVLAYFARFRTSDDAVANFRAVFGESVDEFQQSLDAELAR